jgi:carboxyl-terminal processing protease
VQIGTLKELRSAFREILPSLVPLMIVAAVSGSAAGRPLTAPGGCKAAFALAEVAAERHFEARAVNGEILVQAGRRLGHRIETDAPWLLPEDRAALRDLASEAPALLMKRYSEGDCSIFESYTAIALEGLGRARATYPDEAALAATLPLEPPDATPPSTRAAPTDLDELRGQMSTAALVEVQACRPFASWADCTRFGARRVLRRISVQRGRFAHDEGMEWLDALVASLDPHSRFVRAPELRGVLDDNPVTGMLGIHLGRPVPGGMQVLELVRGSPAGSSGALQPGDVLASVDGVSLDGLGSDEVDELLRSPGDSAVLGVSSREGEGLGPIRLVHLTRRVLEDRSRVMRMSLRPTSLGRVAVVQLMEFKHDAPAEVARAIRGASRGAPLAAVVLDLRGNPGGGLQASVLVAGLFLRGGPVVARVEGDGRTRVHSDDDPSSIFDGTLVVLVDGRTASGAEIVAGALQARGRALVVGAPRTYGKGSVQELISMDPRRGALGLTSALYFLPDGRSPQVTGVVSDVVIARGNSDGERESGLESAIPHPRDMEPLARLTGARAERLSRMRVAARALAPALANSPGLDPGEALETTVRLAGAVATIERPHRAPRVTAALHRSRR